MDNDAKNVPSYIEVCKKIQGIRKNPILILADVNKEIFPLLKVDKVLRQQKPDELDVIIQTRNGAPREGYILAKILKTHARKVNVLVPLFAKGVGVIPSLCADNLLMIYLSELGPLDLTVEVQSAGGHREHLRVQDILAAMEEFPKYLRSIYFNITSAFSPDSDESTNDAVSRSLDAAGGITAQTILKLYRKLTPERIGALLNEEKAGIRYLAKGLMNFKEMDVEPAFPLAKLFVKKYCGTEFCIDAFDLDRMGFHTDIVEGELYELLVSVGTIFTKELQEDERIVEFIPL